MAFVRRSPGRCRTLATASLACVAVLISGPATSADGMIHDPVTGCGTSNPFPAEGETIRWYGSCQNGLLSGHGTLIWYQNGAETQRNEGMFWAGEMHGPTTTTYPDRTQIIGSYNVGRRNGQFMTFRPDGSHTVSVFTDGSLISEHVVPAQQPLHTQRATPTVQPMSLPVGRAISRPNAPAVRPALRAPTRTSTASPTPLRQRFPARQRQARNAIAAEPAFDTVLISSEGVRFGSDPRPRQLANAGLSDAPRFIARPQQTNRAPVAARQLSAGRAPAIASLVPRSAPQQATTGIRQSAQILSPEQRFVQAFAAERAGQLQQAAASYSELAAQYPHTESANLAGERLALLTNAAPAAVKAKPRTAQQLPHDANMTGKYVCTLPGLFDNGSKWCGIVRNANPAYLSVEVKQVKAAGFFNIGFTRAPCTGNTFINYFSRGVRVSVPRNCMGPIW